MTSIVDTSATECLEVMQPPAGLLGCKYSTDPKYVFLYSKVNTKSYSPNPTSYR